jgi:hypothetical protein
VIFSQFRKEIISMNKINLLKLALVVVLSTAASAAYAATDITGATLLGGNSFAPSSNVVVNADTDATSGNTDGNNYSARSKHNKGDKIIGCRSGDSKLYFSTVSNVTTAIGSANVTDTYGSGWTSM